MKIKKLVKKGKIFVKCKRDNCKKLLNQKENYTFNKKVMKYTPKILKKIKGYCDSSCEFLHREEVAIEKAKNTKVIDLHKSDATLIQEAYNVYWAIKNIIYNNEPKVCVKLLEEINKIVEKYKKKKRALGIAAKSPQR